MQPFTTAANWTSLAPIDTSECVDVTIADQRPIWSSCDGRRGAPALD